MRISIGHIVEAGHVNQVGHAAAGKHFGKKNRVEIEAVKNVYFVALVKHVLFSQVKVFRSAFLAPKFENAFVGFGKCFGSLCNRKILERFCQHRFYTGVG